MPEQIITKHIAIIGAGPSGLFLLKTFLDSCEANITIDIFEAGSTAGRGFPYSSRGAGFEHITNVSGNEIPALETSVSDWMKTLPLTELKEFNIDLATFNDYHVFPRLLFGNYLHAQFKLLLEKASRKNIPVHMHINSRVTDIIEIENGLLSIDADGKTFSSFHHVIVCSGHQWNEPKEGRYEGWYDSPYPPAKLNKRFNHPVALRGGSLTAIDAVRTLAKQNGEFEKDAEDKLVFKLYPASPEFRIAMYCLKGLLPGIRFHLEDSHLSADSLLTEEAIASHRAENDGFLSLDFIFEKDFKEPLQQKDPQFYEHIKDMRMETFVEEMMSRREHAKPFELFKAEYEEARQSIKRKESVHWKEMLAILSFAMNYPAKHFSAEDMQRLQQTLMPLISIIIAFVPQDSCEELIALHEAGVLEITAVEKDSHADINPAGGIVYHHKDAEGKVHAVAYQTFINCIGQPHLWLKDFPFKSMVENSVITQALLAFRSSDMAKAAQAKDAESVIEDAGRFYLKVPGIAITDNFNVIGKNNTVNESLYIMAVPFIGGYNPDYSGLDFCEEASGKIVKNICR